MPTLPSSFPIISSNGVTEPSSTSLIRLIFSSITLFSSCGAVVMMTKNMTNMHDRRHRGGANRIDLLGGTDLPVGDPGLPRGWRALGEASRGSRSAPDDSAARPGRGRAPRRGNVGCEPGR